MERQTEFITVKDLAKKKGFSESYIRKAVQQYGLPHYSFGKRMIKFKESEFDAWVEQRHSQNKAG